MKVNLTPSRNALTLVEVLVIIVVLVVLAGLFDVGCPRGSAQLLRRTACMNNLKQVGLAFKIWAGDSYDRYHFQREATQGGTIEWAASGEVWPHFLVMSNELNTPKVLVCPADTRRPATSWASLSNSNISYFIGLNAVETLPEMLLSGDSNLEVDGKPVGQGLLNLWTNSPVAWTTNRHNRCGNVALADGSAQESDDRRLGETLVKSEMATNRLAIP